MISLQLAKEVPLSKLKFPLRAEPKFDGVRLWIIRYKDAVLVKTRNDKIVHLQNKAVFTALPEGVYDCEVTVNRGKMEDRTKVSGMINSAIHKGSIPESTLVYNVFDFLPLADALEAKCGIPLHKRRSMLHMALACTTSQIQLVHGIPVGSIEEVQQLYASMIAQGYEGLILKQEDSLYAFGKRSATWAKMKETKTADLKCVSTTDGLGKYEGMIGALICEGLVEGKQVQVNVGSGLTDFDRAVWPSAYIGKTIEVKYNTVIQDQLGSVHSLFLPRFVAIRFDK